MLWLIGWDKYTGFWDRCQAGAGREFPTPAQVLLGCWAARRTRWRVKNPTTGALGGSFPLPPRFPSGSWSARQTRWRVGNPTTGRWAGGSHSRLGFPGLSVGKANPLEGGKPYNGGGWAGVSRSRPGFPGLPVGASNPLEGRKPYNGAGSLGGSFPLPSRFPSGFWSARQTRWRVENPATGRWAGVSHSRPGSPRLPVGKANPLEGGKPYNGALGGSFPLPSRFSSASGRRVKPVGEWETLQRGLKTTTSYHFKGISLIPCRN